MDILRSIQDQGKAITLHASVWEQTSTVPQIRALLEDADDAKVLSGLQRLMVFVAQGKGAIELFPQVTKLVASSNPEIKRIVHRYLIQYAELEPQMTLMGINLLKKDLGSSNQALRTLSSLRVKMILPVVVQCVLTAAKDSSPYVRKAAAHAAPKILSVDASLQETMEEVVEKLLTDRSTVVVGSASAAFNAICPDRYDMIHINFRRLCEMLIDVDEWGQVPLLALLLRYARTQFVDPDKSKPKMSKKEGVNGAGEESDAAEGDKEDEDDDYLSVGGPQIDADHRFLLDSAQPLLMSMNPAVVMGVVSLFRYLAPGAERPKIGRALVRLIYKGREVAQVALQVITSMAKSDPAIFQPFVADFFVTTDDPVFVQSIKLNLLVLLANDTNIDRILREFKYYTTLADEKLVTATIEAMGQCAMRIPEVTERCLLTLMHLLASKRELVVAQSIVVIKLLLQVPLASNDEGASVNFDEAILQIVRLFDDVTEPSARATIVWIVGEFVDKVKDYAPDVLRRLAKTFAEENDSVKLQVLNLAAKLVLKYPDNATVLAQFVLNLAKFDTNFDIRDRARLLRQLLFDTDGKTPKLKEAAARLMLSKKPTPPRPGAPESEGADSLTHRGKDSHGGDVRDGLGVLLTIDSLSFMLGVRVDGYIPLPDWAEEPSDPSLRRPPDAFMPLSHDVQGNGFEGGNYEDNFWAEEGEYDEGYGEEDFYGQDGFYEEEGYDEEAYYEGDEYYEGEAYEGEAYEGEAYEEEAVQGEDEGHVVEGEADEEEQD